MVILVISHFGFEGGTLVLNASFSGHCLYFTFEIFNIYTWKKVREHLLCYEGILWTKFFL